MKKSFTRFSRYPFQSLFLLKVQGLQSKKGESQNSSFNNLLLPKPGGVGLTLSTMPYINKLIDFSIKYETDKRTFWDFLCGKMNKATIKVNVIDIPQELIGGEYSEDENYRDDVKNWLYDIWDKKDKFLSS